MKILTGHKIVSRDSCPINKRLDSACARVSNYNPGAAMFHCGTMPCVVHVTKKYSKKCFTCLVFMSDNIKINHHEACLCFV